MSYWFKLVKYIIDEIFIIFKVCIIISSYRNTRIHPLKWDLNYLINWTLFYFYISNIQSGRAFSNLRFTAFYYQILHKWSLIKTCNNKKKEKDNKSSLMYPCEKSVCPSLSLSLMAFREELNKKWSWEIYLSRRLTPSVGRVESTDFPSVENSLVPVDSLCVVKTNRLCRFVVAIRRPYLLSSCSCEGQIWIKWEDTCAFRRRRIFLGKFELFIFIIVIIIFFFLFILDWKILERV